MKMTGKQLIAVLLLTALLTMLSTGCKPVHKYSGIEELNYVVETEKDLVHLDEYPDLKKLNLSGSTLDHVQLGDWIAIHPWIEIIYTIPIGNQLVSSEATEMTVAKGQSSFEELMQNLEYLPALTKIMLESTSLTPNQIVSLEKEYEDLDISYSVELANESLDGRITSVDLSHLTGADIATVVRQLPMFAYLTDVQLMDNSGETELSFEDVKLLMQAAPDVHFHYSFELFGNTVTTLDTSLEYTDFPIGNDGIAQLRQALDIMPACSYLKLDNCGVDNDVMSQLRLDYPNTTMAWRVSLGKQSLLTDAEVLRFGREITDSDAHILNYFTEVKYLHIDGGKLEDYSFVQFMPHLESASLPKSQIHDLSPFSGCTNLQWLELAECRKIEDLSPLKDLPNLKYLNISSTSATDLSVLDNVPLENLMCLNSIVPPEQRTSAIAAHPNALVRFGPGYNFGYGWRYSDYNQTLSTYYEKLCKIFGY